MNVLELTTDSIVADLYRALLQREPDPAGLTAYSAMLRDTDVGIADIVRLIIESDEFRTKAAQLLSSAPAPNPDRFTNDVSQYGEVQMLLRLWVNAAAKHRVVVDIGARGMERSNSYDLLRHFGWKGLLVEANPKLIPSIRREFQGVNMELVNCAVSDYDGTAEFFIGANDDVSSLDANAALGWGDIKESIQVPVVRLGPLLEAHNIPPDFDLLSLDIEGADIKVLNDLLSDARYEPQWVIIEASYDFQTKSLTALPFSEAVRSRYRIAGQTRANLILELGKR